MTGASAGANGGVSEPMHNAESVVGSGGEEPLAIAADFRTQLIRHRVRFVRR